MKIDRLLGITILLLNRERVSAKELAERFEVSTKTIYRDMETLNQAGIPISAQQGTSGGFEMMQQFTLRRQFLTLQEMASLLAAVKGMNSAVTSPKHEGLVEKVTALLHHTGDRAQVKQVGQGMIFDFNPWGLGEKAKLKITTLHQAIEERSRVEVAYVDRQGIASVRRLEPISLLLKGNVWYLHAYCTTRKDFRVFRLSRIQTVDVLAERYDHVEVPSLETFDWNTQWNAHQQVALSLHFHPEVRYLAEDRFAPDSITERMDGWIEVKETFVIDEWLYSMLLSYGEYVIVESPASIADELVRRAHQIIKRYSN
ncbi:putative DNA-binding transcriptional regulator YafY [Paenibacillus shirakamiensis]|uniref:DNA-binding transcriptional regulator YafY n=1 Tax=Paenibacillus shirakamiensis TaxID=1265935 RepID=A0ABS4JJX4_9BACL|nr:YafY family protein [Paenibacillus shirakamiensis]MBP2002014.1 putative DNA-binding transcriptional regulator YafY [Paenibacillus shirakamiensis]